MSNDPKYVRLSDRLSSGSFVDTYSHWGITGLDVVEFPADGTPAAQEFVRDGLRRGLLEAASKAEFEEVAEANESIASQVYMDDDTRRAVENAGQEAKVVRAANTEGRRLAASRAGEGGGGAYDADTKRREAILKVQKDLDDGDIAVPDTNEAGSTSALAFGDDNPVNTAVHAEQGGSSDALRSDNGETVPVADLTGQIPQTTDPVASTAPKKAAKKGRAAQAQSDAE